MKWVRELKLVKNKASKSKFTHLVFEKLEMLVTGAANGILVGRLLFDYAFDDIDQDQISYDVAYVQPGIITLPDPISSEYTNFLKCTWLAAGKDDIKIPTEIQLQYIDEHEPYINFHAWDALNPNPCSLFSVQQFNNGFLLFPNLSSFLPQSASSEPKPLPERIQSKKQGDLFAHTKRKLRSPSPHLNPNEERSHRKILKLAFSLFFQMFWNQ